MAEDPAPRPADAEPSSPRAASAPQARRPARTRDAAAGMRRRPPINVMALLLIGAAVGAFGTLSWSVRPSTRVITAVVEAIDEQAVAVLLDHPSATQGYGITGVLWRESAADGEPAGEWRRTPGPEGYPTCLSPADVGRAVQVGLVIDPGGADRPSSEVVAWLECGPQPDAATGAEPPTDPSPADR